MFKKFLLSLFFCSALAAVAEAPVLPKLEYKKEEIVIPAAAAPQRQSGFFGLLKYPVLILGTAAVAIFGYENFASDDFKDRLHCDREDWKDKFQRISSKWMGRSHHVPERKSSDWSSGSANLSYSNRSPNYQGYGNTSNYYSMSNYWSSVPVEVQVDEQAFTGALDDLKDYGTLLEVIQSNGLINQVDFVNQHLGQKKIITFVNEVAGKCLLSKDLIYNLLSLVKALYFDITPLPIGNQVPLTLKIDAKYHAEIYNSVVGYYNFDTKIRWYSTQNKNQIKSLISNQSECFSLINKLKLSVINWVNGMSKVQGQSRYSGNGYYQ